MPDLVGTTQHRRTSLPPGRPGQAPPPRQTRRPGPRFAAPRTKCAAHAGRAYANVGSAPQLARADPTARARPAPSADRTEGTPPTPPVAPDLLNVDQAAGSAAHSV